MKLVLILGKVTYLQHVKHDKAHMFSDLFSQLYMGESKLCSVFQLLFKFLNALTRFKGGGTCYRTSYCCHAGLLGGSIRGFDSGRASGLTHGFQFNE